GRGRGRDEFSVETDLWRASSPAPMDFAMAAGQGGQRLYLAPADGLVIVRQARTLTSSSWSDAQFLSLILRDLYFFERISSPPIRPRLPPPAASVMRFARCTPFSPSIRSLHIEVTPLTASTLPPA